MKKQTLTALIIVAIVLTGLIILISRLKYNAEEKLFLADYYEVLNLPIDTADQSRSSYPFNTFLSRYKESKFLTDPRREEVLYHKAFIHRKHDKFFIDFKSLYPDSQYISVLDSILRPNRIYIVVYTTWSSFGLRELEINNSDTILGEQFGFSFDNLCPQRNNNDEFEGLILVDQDNNTLDPEDISVGSIIEVDRILHKTRKGELDVIPLEWIVLNHIQPKLIVIIGNPNSKVKSKIIYDRFRISDHYRIDRELIPRGYKCVTYKDNYQKAWGILSYTHSKYSTKTDWTYRSESDHEYTKGIKFKNEDNLNTSWNNLPDTYWRRYPNDRSNDTRDYLETGSMSNLPEFVVY